MDYIALHTGDTTLHLEYNTSCGSVVGAKIVAPRVKHTEVPV